MRNFNSVAKLGKRRFSAAVMTKHSHEIAFFYREIQPLDDGGRFSRFRVFVGKGDVLKFYIIIHLTQNTV